VKLKMAPNSLFAVLLRSPWWISLLIALLFAAVARALLPADVWLFGAAGALPFVVIAAMAAWRQFNRPGPARVAAVEQAVRAMSWRDFQDRLAAAFERDGFVVQRLDSEADLAVTRDGRTALVAARRWKAATHGLDAVQALQREADARQAHECLLVTLGALSDGAAAHAREHRMRVIGADGLAVLLRDLNTTAAPR